MKLRQILGEKLSHFVYTKQSIKKLSVILQTNKLIFDDFQAGEKTFYVLRTSPSRKELMKDGENSVAIIQLNGEKLNAELKHKNVDYYLNSKNKDLRDELFSDEKMIPDAANFIEQISILIKGKIIIPVSELKEIETLCKEKNIPLFFYNKKEDFENNRRQNKVALDTPDYNYKKQQFSKIPETVKALLYFANHKDLKNIPARYTKYLNEIVVDQKRPTYLKKLRDDLKDIEKNPLGHQLIVELFKKYNTQDLEVIIRNLATSWKTIINKTYKNQSK